MSTNCRPATDPTGWEAPLAPTVRRRVPTIYSDLGPAARGIVGTGPSLPLSMLRAQLVGLLAADLGQSSTPVSDPDHRPGPRRA